MDANLDSIKDLQALKDQLENPNNLQHDFYKKVINELDFGVAILTPEGRIFDVNQRLCNVLEMKREELFGQWAVNLFTAESKEDIIKNRRLQKSDSYEAKTILKSGEKIWLQISGVNCTILNKPFRISTLRNITGIKALELENRNVNHQYKLLFENMNEAFALYKIVVNENNHPFDFEYIDVNSVFEKTTGFRKEQVLHKTIKQIMPNIEDFWIQTFGKVALTAEPQNLVEYSKELKKYLIIRN